MYRDGKMLGNNAILFICALFCINNVRSTDITYLKIDDDSYIERLNNEAYPNVCYINYDVTTIYKIQDNFIPRLSNFTDSGFMKTNFFTTFNGYYSIGIHSRTNAIGMPINYQDRINLRNNEFTIFDDSWLQTNISENHVSHEDVYWKIDRITSNGNKCDDKSETNSETTQEYHRGVVRHYKEEENIPQCYGVYVFMYNDTLINNMCYRFGMQYEIESTSFSWRANNESPTCLSITYKLKSSTSTFYLIIQDYNNMQITNATFKRGDGIQILKLNNINLTKGQKYKLFIQHMANRNNLCSRSYYSRESMFMLMRISQSSTNVEEITQVTPQKINDLEHPYSFNVLRIEKRLQQYKSFSGCFNGGYKINENIISECICPPGFKGQFCETGCGPNSYGADCKGVCSIHTDRMCRGMLMCTTYGCTCPVGLTGSWCNQDCNSGEYGADCNQKCSSHCRNDTCDQYTGICSLGCVPGYIQPYCLKKYPYLTAAPELISSMLMSLEVKLNFNSTNISGGGTNIELKYYQLFYKIPGEESYNTSEFNLILNDTETTSLISDLEPETTYKVGVLLITDDGNFNDQDIVYGQYTTSCIQPTTTDYNVKLVSGINSLNITWKTTEFVPLYCHVTDYVLTLMSDVSENQEILTSSDCGHFLNDLVPTIEYRIQLTAKTKNGLLNSSPIYSAIPLMKENDAKITNISTVITNRKIKVFWKVLNPYQHYTASFNGSVTFRVKYKLTRVFSCSLIKIEKEWKSITIFNQTSYEISNTIPNSQYTIQVTFVDTDLMLDHYENTVYALTPTSSPEAKPILDLDQPMYVTNNSVYVKWKVDPMECSKLNGFFSKFYFELKNENEIVLRLDTTKENYIYIDNLNSNTSYELRVFIKTSYGYNLEHYLAVSFKTKNEYLKQVDDLTVYKKSLKDRKVGLRWSYLENTNLNEFLVSFDEKPFTSTTNTLTILPEKCTAWPDYFCHTFHNMTFNKNYKFSIKPKSEDYPEGGKVSSISFSAIDGLPDPPTKVLTTDIGNTTVSLQWDIPWIFNGVLKTFNINAEEISSADINTCCSSIKPIEIPIDDELPTYNYTLVDLQPGSTYSIGIISVSKTSWYSSPARIITTTLFKSN